MAPRPGPRRYPHPDALVAATSGSPPSMFRMSQQGPPPPPPPPPPPSGPGRAVRNDQSWPKWMFWALVGVFITVLLITSVAGGDKGKEVAYSTFLTQAANGQ